MAHGVDIANQAPSSSCSNGAVFSEAAKDPGSCSASQKASGRGNASPWS